MNKMRDLPTPKGSFVLQQLIEESLHAFRTEEKYKKISIQLIDDLVSPLTVKGDQNRLRQIFEQSLKNAVELFSAAKIIISLRQLLKTEEEVLLEFTVEDDGLKTQLEYRENSFTYKRGLVKIRSLIEEFGGKAEISSFAGIGTTIKFLAKFFWIETQVDEGNSSEHRLAGKKILVAEDNEINQKIIAHLLKKELLEVDIANDGREAIELFETKEYDLLLLDLQMPFMDGFQTANYIRKKLKSSVPIVAMTASAFANEQTRCFEVGINQYLSKPFAQEDLFKRLRYFLLSEHDLSVRKADEIVRSRDLYSLQSLRQTNDDEGVIEIMELFINDTPALLQQIKKDVSKNEMDSAIKDIAKLKGSLGSLEMQSMLRVVKEIEQFFRLEDFKQMASAVTKLIKEYEIVLPLLKVDLHEAKKKTKAI
jgi:CheY-like chemotaxis protein